MQTNQTEDTATEAPNQRRSRKWRKLLPPVVFLGAALFTFFRSQSFHPPAHVSLADLDLQRLDGARVDAGRLRGKAVVLNFWAPWCPPCRLEMPWLQDLQNKHPDIIVLGVEADPAEYANGVIMAADKHISFPLLRMTDSVRGAVGDPGTLPTTLYIDASGKVVHTISGAIPEPLMVRFANDALRSH
jgi:thiol-disulfide isomerase/thioredoxin